MSYPDQDFSPLRRQPAGSAAPWPSFWQTVKRFGREESGAYAAILALALPCLVGAAALGTEEGLLLYKQRQMQHAADSSALSAATAYVMSNANIATQANSVAASYGFVSGTNAKIRVNQPPQSGTHRHDAGAIEVIITQDQPRLFSALWGSAPIPVTARSVSMPQNPACVLALDPNASGAFTAQGSVAINLVNCAIHDDSAAAQAMSVGGSATVSAQFVGVVGGISGKRNITTVDGTVSGYRVVQDPYAGVSPPSFSGCDHKNFSTNGTATIGPGVYCGGMNLGAQANVTLTQGIYYLDQGSLSMAGGATLSGTGVTLVFTSSTGSNYAGAKLSGGASLNLVAPTSGTMSGIAIYGDRNMPVGTQFDFRGGNNQAVGGAIDLPKASITWVGDATTQQPCTQLIGDTIQFVGNSGLSINCGGYGTKSITAKASLLE